MLMKRSCAGFDKHRALSSVMRRYNTLYRAVWAILAMRPKPKT